MKLCQHITYAEIQNIVSQEIFEYKGLTLWAYIKLKGKKNYLLNFLKEKKI
jgi:hypothetical protein